MVLPNGVCAAFDRVDVDELMVASGFCEQVDTCLVDGQPFGTSQFLADIIFELRYRYVGIASLLGSSMLFYRFREPM